MTIRLPRFVKYFLYFLLLWIRRPVVVTLQLIGGTFILMFLGALGITLFLEVDPAPPIWVHVMFFVIGFGCAWLAWLFNILCLRLNPHPAVIIYFDKL